MGAGGAKWAVVTGASSGLGAELARGLGARGVNVVLVARRAAPMEVLAAELREQHGVQAMVEVADLSEGGAAEALGSRLDRLGVRPEILVNNAAFGLSARSRRGTRSDCGPCCSWTLWR